MKRFALAAALVLAPLVAFAGGELMDKPHELLVSPTQTELEAIESLERRQSELNARASAILEDARVRVERETPGFRLEKFDAQSRKWRVTEIAVTSSTTPPATAPVTTKG